jgi:hypothetical protein
MTFLTIERMYANLITKAAPETVNLRIGLRMCFLTGAQI